MTEKRRERIKATIAHIEATYQPAEAKAFVASFRARLKAGGKAAPKS